MKSMMLLLVAALGSMPCWSQQVLLPTEVKECGLARQLVQSGPNPGTAVTFLQQVGDNIVAAVHTRPISTGPAQGQVNVAIGTGTTQLVLCSANQGDRVLKQFAAGGQPRAASGEWVFASEPVQGRWTGRLLNFRTGQESPIELKGMLIAAALDGNRLAVVTQRNSFGRQLTGPGLLEIYDCDSLKLLSEGALDNAAMFSELYFTGPESLVLVDRAGVSFTPISLAGGVRAQMSVTLSGSDIDSLRNRPPGRISPGAYRILVHAYSPSSDGNHFFFLAGGGASEIRMIKFDQSGRQIASYGLRLQSGMTDRLAPMPWMITTTATGIVVGSLEGKAFAFERPL
jgi:hypothetical protein